MRSLTFHAAGALMTALGLVCLLAATAVAAVVGGMLAIPAAVVVGAATFEALRVPVGRAVGRLVER
jgi:hypothetical protein